MSLVAHPSFRSDFLCVSLIENLKRTFICIILISAHQRGSGGQVEIRNAVFVVVAVFVNIVASYAALVVAPVEETLGDLYRIFYIHTPSAWVLYLSLGIALVSSMLYLVKRSFIYDTLAEVSAILGLLYGAIALVTGSIWSEVAWGAYWNWDPRQTTTLILWIAYMGYLALRLSIGNVEKRASIGAVYNILAFITVPLSYMSVRLWQTLHPQIVSGTGISITQPMIETLLLNLVASSLVYILMLRTMYSLWRMQDQIHVFTYEKEV